MYELPVAVHLTVPAEITVSVYDENGLLVRRLAFSQLARPSLDGVVRLYWDGRDSSGAPVLAGRYIIAAEALIDGIRQKAASSVNVSAP